jgi:hypothetical protein
LTLLFFEIGLLDQCQPVVIVLVCIKAEKKEYPHEPHPENPEHTTDLKIYAEPLRPLSRRRH